MYRPKVGMEVELRYNKRLREWTGLHLAKGVVRLVGAGGGPINALIELRDGRNIVVPRGHLFENRQLDLFDGR